MRIAANPEARILEEIRGARPVQAQAAEKVAHKVPEAGRPERLHVQPLRERERLQVRRAGGRGLPRLLWDEGGRPERAAGELLGDLGNKRRRGEHQLRRPVR